MDEQKKYEVIKALAYHPDGNKDRAAMTLDCSKRHVNRMLKAYKEQGRAFFIHGNRGRQPSTTIPEATRNAVVSLYRTKYYDANFHIIPNCWQPMRTSISLLLLLQRYWKATASSPQRLQKPRKNA